MTHLWLRRALYLNIYQKPMARDRHGSTTLYQKPIITENDEKGKSSAVAGGGGGGGQDTKVTSLRRLEAWGKGGGERSRQTFSFGLLILELCHGQGQPGSWLQMCMGLASRFFYVIHSVDHTKLPLYLVVLRNK